MEHKSKRNLVFVSLALVVAAGICFYVLLDFATVKHWCLEALGFAEAHPVLAAILLFSVNALVQVLALPLKVFASLAAGALLGWLWGGAVTLAGVTSGATLLFTLTKWSRIAIPERLRMHDLGSRLIERFRTNPIRGVAGLRMIVTLPYPPITVAAALAGIPLSDFVLGSILGDAPVAFLYTFAGERLKDLVTPGQAVSMRWAILLLVAAVILFGSMAITRKSRPEA